MANGDKITCSLTANEVEELIVHHGRNIGDDADGRIERINYLNKRLKASKEPETETKPATTATVQGWGTPST